MGIHTALDTNGYFGDRLSDDDLEAVNLVLLDLKTWDPERHRQLTGMDVAPTLEFARRLAARKRPIWVRFVLVPGLTDDRGGHREDRQLRRRARQRGAGRRAALPPDGPLQVERLGIEYTLDDVEPPSADLIERTLAIFRAEGLKAY